MRNSFTFAGTASTVFGVYISGSGVFKAPTRLYEVVDIPGRDGDVLGLSHRLENVEITYPAFVYSNFKTNVAALRDFLLGQIGYQRLTDTYNADEFRLAYYAGGLEPDMLANLRAGRFDITFNCKPQRYLASGETVTRLTANGSVTNPTNQTAKPLIRIYGVGTVGVGSNAITVTSNPGHVDVDCELMEAYYGPTSLNSQIQTQGNDFPALHAGQTGITLGAGITAVEITPRWYRL